MPTDPAQPDFFGIELEPVPAEPDPRKAWTGWSKGMPKILTWWGPTRAVHWPKWNRTDLFSAASELVGEEKWGIHGDW